MIFPNQEVGMNNWNSTAQISCNGWLFICFIQLSYNVANEIGKWSNKWSFTRIQNISNHRWTLAQSIWNLVRKNFYFFLVRDLCRRLDWVMMDEKYLFILLLWQQILPNYSFIPSFSSTNNRISSSSNFYSERSASFFN